MITCEQLFEIFKKSDLTYFTGVPDSTFKDWMSFLEDENGKRLVNRIAPSECEAIAFASGYNLATGKIPIIYMQNSGFGKTINPLTSLADKEVYSIPMILMIGWRGEPGKHDEPQHKKMGRIILDLLNVLEIPYEILPQDFSGIEKAVINMKEKAEKTSAPTALIVKSDTFEKYLSNNFQEKGHEMNREDAMEILVNNLREEDIVVSTTGKTSRELYEYRERKGQPQKDFLQVGSMGCCAPMAFETACQKKDRRVFAFDGDGAVLMQLGSLSAIGNYAPKNFYHIIFDNQSYESTGGQPTVSPKINFPGIAKSCNYNKAVQVETKKDLIEAIKEMETNSGPYMLVVKVNPCSRADLGRPKKTPLENKNDFKEHLSK
ncbi:Sulfopyruvate decarboxylase [uncultured archaeon]|nr:Sulfopyruvate decarboxylase [uncultured archaeon]